MKINPSRFKIGTRLVLISLAFMIPIAVQLFLLVGAHNADIRFARWETYGNAFQRPLMELLDLLPRHQLATHHLGGEDAAQLEAKIDESFQRLATAQAQWGEALKFTPEELDRRNRTRALPSSVGKEWTDLKAQLAQLDAATLDQKHTEIIQDVRTMITHAGDLSNLILDPDLDSYYLMDATLVALPQALDRLATQMAGGATALATGETSQAQRTQFAIFAALFQESDLDRLKGDFDTAFNEDPNFHGTSPTLIAKIKPAAAAFAAVADPFAELARKAADGQPVDPVAFLQSGAKARTAASELWRVSVAELDLLLENRIADFQHERLVNIGATLCALAAALALVVVISRGIAGSVHSVMDVLGHTAAGLNTASAEIGHATQSLAASAGQQAASLEETSAAIEELSSMTQRNATHAQRARELTTETRATADAGRPSVAQMTAAMAEIQASSDGIGKIIKTIDEIAFQTNLLALNAAIEAARAGDAGTGFAVVADEVRGLAKRCGEAARETSERLEDSIRKSAHGAQASGNVERSFQEIVDKMRSVESLVAEIADASAQQDEGIRQISSAVAQLDTLTQTNAAAAAQTASAAEGLSQPVAELGGAATTLSRLSGGNSGPLKANRKPAAPHSSVPRKSVPKASLNLRKPAPPEADLLCQF